MNTGLDLQGNAPHAMDFRFLFLEPQGRLAPKPFAQGLVLLTGASLIVTVVSAISAPGLGPLQLALVFPCVCLFAKRLHDAGLSAWLWFAFLAGYGLVNIVATSAFFQLLSPQAYAMQDEVQTMLEQMMKGGSSTVELEYYVDRMQLFTRLSAVTSVVSLLLASAVVGFAAFRMRSDPKPNRHGPPTDDIARAGGTFS